MFINTSKHVERNTKTNSKFLGKALTKNVIRLQYNIERKRKKEINITDKDI